MLFRVSLEHYGVLVLNLHKPLEVTVLLLSAHIGLTVGWTAAIVDCRHDPRKLWSTVGQLMQQKPMTQTRHTAAEIAAHFSTKIAAVRSSTADAAPPAIDSRVSTMLSEFDEVTVDEATKLLSMSESWLTQF